MALLWADGWADAAFGGELPPRRRGFKLEGTYTCARSVGVGTSVSVHERTFALSADGRFVFSASGAVAVGDLWTDQNFVGSFPADQRGTYEIDGYVMRLEYDSGSSEVTSFVFEAGGEVIYIGGTWYNLN